MKEIQEGGIYDNLDMADWFGLTYNGFRNNKQKKLQEFKEYAEFEIITKGRVHVTKVFYPVFIRHRRSQDKWYQKEISKILEKNPYQTDAHLAFQLKQEQPEKIGDKPLELITTDVRINLEKIFAKDKESFNREEDVGYRGKSYWVKDCGDQGFVPLERNQLKVFQNILIDEYAKSGLDLAINQSKKDFKEIEKGEYNDNLKTISEQRFNRAKKRFKEKFGFTPIAATKYELNYVTLKSGKKRLKKKGEESFNKSV